MSDYISTNSEIQHQFRINYKGGKASQLWLPSCSAQIQWSKWREIHNLVTATLFIIIIIFFQQHFILYLHTKEKLQKQKLFD